MWAVFPCPGCQSLVHRDMRDCPRCGRSLAKMVGQSNLPAWVAEVTLWPSGKPDHSDQEELHCPECHEVGAVAWFAVGNAARFCRHSEKNERSGAWPLLGTRTASIGSRRDAFQAG